MSRTLRGVNGRAQIADEGEEGLEVHRVSADKPTEVAAFCVSVLGCRPRAPRPREG